MAKGKLGRVLIVEDEADIGELVEAMLGHLGYIAFVASSGAEALRLAPDYRPDIVLLDLALAEMPGDVVMKHLQQMNPHTRVAW